MSTEKKYYTIDKARKHGKEAIVKWRSKILIVSFYDDEGTRVITDLDIR